MISSIAANWNALSAGITDALVAITDWVDDRIGRLSDRQITTANENLTDLADSTVSVLVGGATKGVAFIGGLLVGVFLFLVTFFFGLRDYSETTQTCNRKAVPYSD